MIRLITHDQAPLCFFYFFIAPWMSVVFPLLPVRLPPGRQCGHAEDGPDASNEPRIAFPADCTASRRFSLFTTLGASWCTAMPLQCHCNATAMHFVQRLTPKVWTCGRVCYISHSMPEKLKKWTMRGSIGFFWHNWVSEEFPLKRSCLEVPPSCYTGWRISPNYLQMMA